jgi:pyruvate ferredoxin oxidoreductase gamma subunit
VMEPDALIIQDATLLHQVDLFNGLRPGGTVLINATRGPDELGLGELVASNRYKLFTLPATEIALKHVGRAVPNVPLLAAFAALTGVVKLESVIAAIRDKFAGKVGEGNVAAATSAFERVRKEQEGLHA